jgi:HD-like signal output (HDOD) protein/two-component sensor histidine kinase
MLTLHSPPAILVKVANLLSDDNLDLASLSGLIERDPGLSAQLLDIGNSVSLGKAGETFSVQQTVMRMGLREVKTLVLSSLLRQFYDRQEIGQEFVQSVWKRSIQTAVGALRIAEITGFPNPAEAYMAGLLTKIGQLLLIGRDQAAYLKLLCGANHDNGLMAAEHAAFGTDHCAVGADLVDAWQIRPFIGAAIRHHLKAAHQLDQAHPLIKIVNLAAALEHTAEASESECLRAYTLLKLTEEFLIRLKSEVNDEISALSSLLGLADLEGRGLDEVSLHADRERLRRCVEQLSRVMPFEANWSEIESASDLESSIRRSVYALEGLNVAMVLYADPTGTHLYGHRVYLGRTEMPAPLNIALTAGQCSFSEAVRTHRNLLINDSTSLIEIEFRNLIRSKDIILSPVYANHSVAGLLVLTPAPDSSLPDLDASLGFKSLKVIIGRMIKHHLTLSHSGMGDDDRVSATDMKIREAVHEASNPLSVIGTYLELLKSRHQKDDRESQQIAFIQLEIERVGNILLRLRDPLAAPQAADRSDLANILKNVTSLFQNSLCLSRQVNLTLNLGHDVPQVQIAPASLKQIMINLIKNAIEALKPSQAVTVCVNGTLVTNGKHFCELVVADNGPGIPETVVESLFSPFQTRKGSGHRGLGLSIVKSLLDEAGGQILCRTSASGSQFQILLPVSCH